MLKRGKKTADLTVLYTTCYYTREVLCNYYTIKRLALASLRSNLLRFIITVVLLTIRCCTSQPVTRLRLNLYTVLHGYREACGNYRTKLYFQSTIIIIRKKIIYDLQNSLVLTL